MSHEMLLAVYCDLAGAPWIGTFDLSNAFALLRTKICQEALLNVLPHGISAVNTSLYFLAEGVPYEPEPTLRVRLHEYLSSHSPQKVALFSKASDFIRDTSEPRVQLILGLPDRPLVTLRAEDTSPTTNDTTSHSEAIQVQTRQEPKNNGSHQPPTVNLDLMPIELFSPSFAFFLSLIDHKANFDADDTSPTFTMTLPAVLEQLLSDSSSELPNLEIDRAAACLYQILGLDGENTSYERDVATQSISLHSKIKESARAPIAVFKYVADDSACLSDDVDEKVLIRTAIDKCGKRWAWSERKLAHKKCSCPVFGVFVTDTWISVYGGMFDNQWVVQLLRRSSPSSLSYNPPSYPPPKDAQSFTRVFHALRASLAHIQTWYPAIVRELHGVYFSRMDPAPTTFIDPNNEEVEFQYVRRLLDHVPNLFIILVARSFFILKFTPSYGQEAHQLLADAELAPELIYCGALYHASAPEYKGMRMVIMNFFAAGVHPSLSYPPPPEVCVKVREAVRLLHEHDFVHGDLRWHNVMFDDERSVQIIDFDWSGTEGEARYPDDLTNRVLWPKGAGPGKLITKAHDEFWVEKLFPMDTS